MVWPLLDRRGQSLIANSLSIIGSGTVGDFDLRNCNCGVDRVRPALLIFVKTRNYTVFFLFRVFFDLRDVLRCDSRRNDAARIWINIALFYQLMSIWCRHAHAQEWEELLNRRVVERVHLIDLLVGPLNLSVNGVN